MKTIIKTLSVGLAFALTSPALASGVNQKAKAQTVLSCTADFSKLVEQEFIMKVLVQKNTDGTLSSNVNNEISNSKVFMTEYNINEKIFSLDLEDEDTDTTTLNFGEQRLLATQNLIDDPIMEGMMKVSFDLTKTAKIKAYDLEGNSENNKFGGLLFG